MLILSEAVLIGTLADSFAGLGLLIVRSLLVFSVTTMAKPLDHSLIAPCSSRA